MDKTETLILAPEPILIDKDTPGTYPYMYVKFEGGVYIYLDPVTLSPVSYVHEKARSWLGQYVVGIMVHRLAVEGFSDRDIRKVVRAFYPAYNADHLGGTVWKKTFEGALTTSLQYEKLGWNTRHKEALAVRQHPELIAFAFDITSKKAR